MGTQRTLPSSWLSLEQRHSQEWYLEGGQILAALLCGTGGISPRGGSSHSPWQEGDSSCHPPAACACCQLCALALLSDHMRIRCAVVGLQLLALNRSDPVS